MEEWRPQGRPSRAMTDVSPLADIAKYATGGVTGAALLFMAGQFFGGLLQPWVNGTGKQEKAMRTDLAAECERLSKSLDGCRDEIDQLRQDVRQMNRMYLHQYTTREKARGMVNALEKLAGMPETVWPPDPPETLNAPRGGPP